MAIVLINDGDTIEAADFTTSWAAVRTEINAMSSSNVRHNSFGKQVLPSILAPRTMAGGNFGHDKTTWIALQTVSIAMTDETTVVSQPWQTLAVLSAGYTLPPCKVLVMASFDLDEWGSSGGNITDQQAWFAITADVGAGETFDQTDVKFVMAEAGHAGAALTHSWTAFHRVTMWSVIDKTAAGGDWTLAEVRLRAAKNDGAGSGGVARNWTTTRGMLSFVAFYRDD